MPSLAALAALAVGEESATMGAYWPLSLWYRVPRNQLCDYFTRCSRHLSIESFFWLASGFSKQLGLEGVRC